MTQQILQRFPHAQKIKIDHYKDVFARGKQNFPLQKKTMKLIIAEKKETLIYKGAEVSQDFGHDHFYYTSSVFNCLYNCEYCFLQGMFPSAHLVMFVNIEDYFQEIEQLLAKHPVYLSISYESDLLALERIAPFCSQWMQFTQEHPSLCIEIRTKSANYSSIRHIPVADNIILAWTLSPNVVAEQVEHDTPSFSARLASIKQAIADGWKVRLSFDPILHVPDWKKHYREMVETTFAQLPADRLTDISIGVFRISKDYLKKMRKDHPASALIHYPYELHQGVYTYPDALHQELVDYVYQLVSQHISKEQVFIW